MNPFTASRRDGKLILEIDEQRFLRDAVLSATDRLSITDRERFLHFALDNIFTLTHDISEMDLPTSWWLRLSQALGKAAASTNQGVQRFETPVPTCGCDPEEYDGG